MIYFNSFTPLCTTLQGQAAIERYKLPRVIDGSCRREPDFQSKYPSITALCRAEKFAPRVYPGDIVEPPVAFRPDCWIRRMNKQPVL